MEIQIEKGIGYQPVELRKKHNFRCILIVSLSASSIEDFVKLVRKRRLLGIPLSGYRCSVDSPGRIAEARKAKLESRCKIRLNERYNDEDNSRST